LSDRSDFVKRHIICLLSLLFAGGSYFFLELFETYLAVVDKWHDNLNVDLLFLVAFCSLTIGAALRAIVDLLRGREVKVVICRVLFVICASVSVRFHFELVSLSDDVFFLLSEPSFRSRIQAAGDETMPVILHGQSSRNEYKIFVYSGSRHLPQGRISLDDIDAFGGDLDFVRGCKVYASYLRDDFYILIVHC
jgi:hypothetical protein